MKDKTVGNLLLDDDTPSEDDRKGVISTSDVVYDGSRVQAELGKESQHPKRDRDESGRERGAYGVDDEVVQEPSAGNGKESDPVALDDQPVGNLGVPHGIALVPLRLVHIQSPDEDCESGNDTETKGETPDSPEVVGTETVIQRLLSQRARSKENKKGGKRTSSIAPAARRRRPRNQSQSLCWSRG